MNSDIAGIYIYIYIYIYLKLKIAQEINGKDS